MCQSGEQICISKSIKKTKNQQRKVNSLELANVPMGAGVSIALCPSESLMYLKMYQNGTPQIAAYTIIPYEKKENEIENSKLQEIISRIESIEEKLLNKKGGQINGLL